MSALGIPITPTSHKIFKWMPEPLLLALMRRKLDDEATSIKIGHALHADREMKAIADDFSELARRAGVETPAMDTLRSYLEGAEPIADGSAEISVNWRSVWITFFVVAVLMVLAWQLFR
jgi:hypothetical protein